MSESDDSAGRLNQADKLADLPLTDMGARDKSGSNGAISLFLSLYMLLLAIFILLNSITTFEESRIRQALGSVNDKFRTNSEITAQNKDDKDRSGDALIRRQFFTGLQELFAERLPVARVQVSEDGNVLRIEIPLDFLFSRESSVIHPRSDQLLAGVADSLVLKVANLRYEAEFLMPTESAGGSSRNGPLTTDVLRAGAFARKLRELGVPSSAISVGTRDGAAGRARLNFYARRLAHASITFEGLEDGI